MRSLIKEKGGLMAVKHYPYFVVLDRPALRIYLRQYGAKGEPVKEISNWEPTEERWRTVRRFAHTIRDTLNEYAKELSGRDCSVEEMAFQVHEKIAAQNRK
jgi:hypothetical protein